MVLRTALPRDRADPPRATPRGRVCLGCAVFLKRRATARRDTGNRSPATRARGAINTARDAVISRGWHEHGPLGRLLRRIDRYFP